MAFVSSDKLHRTCAPLFLDDDQSFVWGHDLKADLGRAVDYFGSLPESTRELGLNAFAHSPPECCHVLGGLWDQHLRPDWRKGIPQGIRPSREDPELIAKLRKMTQGKAISARPSVRDESDFMVLQRRISKKRGSWWQLPKDLRDSGDGGSEPEAL
jgi:hypothetical protein